jgi:hypothetical protein
VKRFNIVVPKEDGGVEVYAMKEWLRRHPQKLPAGLDATSSTSHQLRNGLRRSGWSVQETASEVRLIPPVSRTPEVLGGDDDSGEKNRPRPALALSFSCTTSSLKTLAPLM